jgi:hypothetical protein
VKESERWVNREYDLFFFLRFWRGAADLGIARTPLWTARMCFSLAHAVIPGRICLRTTFQRTFSSPFATMWPVRAIQRWRSSRYERFDDETNETNETNEHRQVDVDLLWNLARTGMASMSILDQYRPVFLLSKSVSGLVALEYLEDRARASTSIKGVMMVEAMPCYAYRHIWFKVYMWLVYDLWFYLMFGQARLDCVPPSPSDDELFWFAWYLYGNRGVKWKGYAKHYGPKLERFSDPELINKSGPLELQL